MKLFSLLFSMLTIAFSSLLAQTPCVNGMAGEYPCENIDFLSFMSGSALGGGSMNDVWGWTDPDYGTEYVLLGRTSGTSFIDISNPVNPVYLGNLPASGSNSTWRDIKVDGNYAYIVSEAGGHGMQIFDLTKLRDVTSPPETFEEDAHYSGWGNAHNIVINEDTHRAYGVGTNTSNGGLHIVDISNPLNPTIIGDFASDGYTHDAQVVTYTGPDVNYEGHEIAFACNENSVTIIDVTDPSDANQLSRTTYNSQYTHQGWLTEDHKYFLSNDELDEVYTGVNTTTFIWDVQDLNSPSLIGTFVAETEAIDHNLYIKGDLCYQSNYRAGLRITSLNDVANGILTEVGFFDIYPSSDGAQFNGTWSNYPYFESGVVAVSHIEEGLFLLGVAGNLSDLGCTDPEACNYDPSALEDNGSCTENDACGVCGGDGSSCSGCTNPIACNYNPSASIDDGSCIIGGVEITFTILTDNYPGETTWNIADANGTVVMSGGPYSSSSTTYSNTVCVDDGCYDLTIDDSFGDGICCGYGIGNYEITSQGETLVSGGEFASTETVNFCVSGGEPDVPGCTDSYACNFDSTATLDDGSCDYTSCAGCTNPNACNFDSASTLDDGSCDYTSCVGCTDDSACNFESAATIDDGSCEYESCACPGDVNGDGSITVADILTILSEFGCTSSCTADVDGDGSVTVSDVLVTLSVFGNLC